MTNILNWIDVGKVSAERDELLSEYFYDNGVLRGVIDNPSAFLVLGRKGAGKTAVFRYFKECYTDYLSENDILVTLSFEDYNWSIHALLQNPEFATSLVYKQSWRFVILIEVIKAFTQWAEEHRKTIPKPIQQSNKLLQKLFNRPIPSIYEIIGKKLLSLSKVSLPKGGLNLEDGSFDSIELNAGAVSFESVRDNNDLQNQLSQNLENLIKTLETAIDSIQNIDFRIFLAFDRVDEAWDDISIESSKAEPSYSEWLKQELIDEWSTQLPEIITLLDAIQNNGSTNITKASLIIELKKLGVFLTESEALQKLRFLFNNSIIGLKLGQSRQWLYKCFYPSQGFIDSDEYRVHDGLVRALNLTEPRSE